MNRHELTEMFVHGDMDDETFKHRFIRSLEDETYLCNTRGVRLVMDRECRRLDLPRGSSIDEIAEVAVVDARKRRDNSSNFSRTCAICLIDDPLQRSVFTACGYVVCRACAETLYMNADDDPACPFCRRESEVTTLVEDETQEHDEFIVNYLRHQKKILAESIREGEHSFGQRKLLAWLFINSELKRESYLRKYRLSLENEALRYMGIADDPIDFVIVEEAQRLDVDLPRNKQIVWLAKCLVGAQWSQSRLQLIDHLRSQENNSRRYYSRTCACCKGNAPPLRSVFTECGHVVCRVCAEGRRSSSCLICHKDSAVVNLFENEIDKNSNEE